MSRRAPAVSILASQGNGTLYIGVTSNLAPRIWLHRQGTAQGFARQIRHAWLPGLAVLLVLSAAACQARSAEFSWRLLANPPVQRVARAGILPQRLDQIRQLGF